MIIPGMWDDRHFVPLEDHSKLLWCYLLTGNNDGVPGLWKGGVGTFSDAMRWSRPKTTEALEELLGKCFIQYDPYVQLVRVPGAPRFRPCTNQNVLKGWYRRWQDVGESELKYQHVESIRSAVEEKKFYAEWWPLTFGNIRAPSPSKQMPLFLMPAPSGTEGSAPSEPTESTEIESTLESHSESGLEINLTSTSTSTSTSVSTSTEYDRPRVPDAIERHMAATSLWALQEELRAELAPGVKPRSSTPHDLKPIMEALERYEVEELENALRVNAATAACDPEKLQYFNGYSNWHPNSLRRTVGQVMPAGMGRQSVRGRKKFGSGSVL